jgi:hypothetical protein
VFCEIVDEKPVSQEIERAFTAGRFYQEALHLFARDVELAYISLVNAGEVLVGGLEFSEEELFDPDFLRLLRRIEEKMGGDALRQIRSRLFQVRRRFFIGLKRLVSPAFFDGYEGKHPFLAIRQENFEQRMAAAYDLRSRYLHAGTRFESWVRWAAQSDQEVVGGEPAYGDREWKTLIARIPNFFGLERVIRFALLRFIHQKIAQLHEKLDDPPSGTVNA